MILDTAIHGGRGGLSLENDETGSVKRDETHENGNFKIRLEIRFSRNPQIRHKRGKGDNQQEKEQSNQYLDKCGGVKHQRNKKECDLSSNNWH